MFTVHSFTIASFVMMDANCSLKSRLNYKLKDLLKTCKSRVWYWNRNLLKIKDFNLLINNISLLQALTKSITRMHVYLKDGNQRRWVTNVHLQEGFSPCIGNGAMKKSCADVSRLEPAIWFKVLLLESVSVDCGRRIVSWSTGSHPEG